MAPRRTPRRPGPAARSLVCVYCGHRLTPSQANKWPGACGIHSDLPARDPLYMLSLRGGQP